MTRAAARPLRSMVRAAALLRLLAVAAAAARATVDAKGNPWKEKGARADDYNGQTARELQENERYFKERELGRKNMLRGGNKKPKSKTNSAKKKKAAKKARTKDPFSPSKLNHHHHHEGRR